LTKKITTKDVNYQNLKTYQTHILHTIFNSQILKIHNNHNYVHHHHVAHSPEATETSCHKVRSRKVQSVRPVN